MQHEVQVELFRNRPMLALALLEVLGLLGALEGRDVTARVVSIDLSEAAPPEFRCDVLIEIVGDDGRRARAVIVEVQLDVNARKLYTWPAYVAVAEARLACPVTLLVVALDPEVAAWAASPIALGHPGFVLRPIVVGGDVVPAITEMARAVALPELAVLSALAHRETAVAEAAYAGIGQLPEDQRKVYWDMILAALPGAARAALEAKMLQKYEYQSDVVRKYYGEGRTEGLATALRKLLATKFGTTSAEAEARIAAATPDELVSYLERILTADSVDAVFDA